MLLYSRGAGKQARLHVFTLTGTVRLFYMCLNCYVCVTCVYALCVFMLHVLKRTLCLCNMYLHTLCVCVTCVYTYQSATPQQDTRGQLMEGAEFLVRSSKVAFSSTLTREFCSRWSLCQNNGCCSLLSSSYRSRPSRYATPPPPRD